MSAIAAAVLTGLSLFSLPATPSPPPSPVKVVAPSLNPVHSGQVHPDASYCAVPTNGSPTDCTEMATLWYNSSRYGYGSGTGFTQSNPAGSTVYPLQVSNLAGFTFSASGAGQGQYLKNNAAASTNNNSSSYIYVDVWYNSGYHGPVDSIPPATTRDLVATKNEDASLGTVYFT